MNAPAEQDGTDNRTASDAAGFSPDGGVKSTWAYTLGSMVFFFVVFDAMLAILASQAFAATHGARDGLMLLMVLGSAAVHLRYCWFLRAGSGGGLPRTGWTIALVLTAAGAWVLGLFMPGVGLLASMPLWMAACQVACLLTRYRRWVLLAGALALALTQLAVTGPQFGAMVEAGPGANDRALAVYAAALPLMLFTSLWWWEIVVKLDVHRRTAAELAVAKERLRFASDLHDIQGHHLQVIALKSELAERLLDRDLEAARGHIHETREIAKLALEETRALVSGYREVALDNELENAREVLGAAGAVCELSLDRLPGDPELRHVLAMVVREATTNILRHSNATRASIVLRRMDGGYTLVIVNDGVDDPGGSSDGRGSGLAGLRERSEALGGRLHTGINRPSGDYELTAWMPAGKGMKA